jgi:hypothetical protein
MGVVKPSERMFWPRRQTNGSRHTALRRGKRSVSGLCVEGFRISRILTPHERLYIRPCVLSTMADSEDIDERMDDAEEFFEGDDQWYHIDDYVDEDGEEKEDEQKKEPEEG